MKLPRLASPSSLDVNGLSRPVSAMLSSGDKYKFLPLFPFNEASQAEVQDPLMSLPQFNAFEMANIMREAQRLLKVHEFSR